MGRGACFHKADQSTLDWSLHFKKCELLSKATAFPVQWHIGRHRILPIMKNTAWEPAHEHLGWDSWKSAQKEHTEAHEFLKWNVPMELLSLGVLNEKPDFGGTSCCRKHSNSGNETWEMEWANLLPCYCKIKMHLVRTDKQPQRPLHILPWLMGPDFAARVNAISMHSWESVKPVANTRWGGDSIFPMKLLVQSRGKHHMQKYHSAEKPPIHAEKCNT